MADFEPRIVTFCCNWCSYAGADGAGVARLQKYGFDPKRLKLEWVSASEGEKFQKTIVEFVDTIKELGPTPLVKEAN